MSIYEFKCDSCGYEFEKILRFTEITSVVCPVCGSPTDHKIMSALGNIKNFEAHYQDHIDHKPVLVRNRQDLKDALARHNDSELASKVGKLRAYDG